MPFSQDAGAFGLKFPSRMLEFPSNFLHKAKISFEKEFFFKIEALVLCLLSLLPDSSERIPECKIKIDTVTHLAGAYYHYNPHEKITA
jgi:hypothetical protein